MSDNGFYESFRLTFSLSSILGTMPYKYDQIDINCSEEEENQKVPERWVWKNWRQTLTVLWAVGIAVSWGNGVFHLIVLLYFMFDETRDLMQRGKAMESSLFLTMTAFSVSMVSNCIYSLRKFQEVPRIIDKLRFLEEYAIKQCLYEEKELNKLRRIESMAGKILGLTLLILTITPYLILIHVLRHSLFINSVPRFTTFTIYELARIPQFSYDLQMCILFSYIGNRCKLLNQVLNDISEQVRQGKERPKKENLYFIAILRSGKQQQTNFDVECDSSFTICKKKTRRYWPVVCTTLRHVNRVHRGLAHQLQQIFDVYQVPVLFLVIIAAETIGSALLSPVIVPKWDLVVNGIVLLISNSLRLTIVFIPLSLSAQKLSDALIYLSLINNACLSPDCITEVQLFSRRVLNAPFKFIVCRVFKCTLSFLGRMALGIISYLLIMLQYNKTVSKENSSM